MSAVIHTNRQHVLSNRPYTCRIRPQSHVRRQVRSPADRGCEVPPVSGRASWIAQGLPVHLRLRERKRREEILPHVPESHKLYSSLPRQSNLLCGHTRSCGCMKHWGLKLQKFGLLTPKKRLPGTRDWACQCACGNQIVVNQDDLFWGSILDCGCQKKKRSDIAGQRFGRLIALRETEPGISRSGVSIPRWLCRCDCGRELVVRKNNLTGRITRSCGCLRSKKARLGASL